MTLEQVANYILDVQSHEAFRDLKGLGDLQPRANYVLNMQSHETCQDLKALGDLCIIMVAKKKDITYPMVSDYSS